MLLHCVIGIRTGQQSESPDTYICIYADVPAMCIFTCVSVTFCLDPECGSDQCKQCGVEHHCSIAVQRHVHRHQTLQETERFV